MAGGRCARPVDSSSSRPAPAAAGRASCAANVGERNCGLMKPSSANVGRVAGGPSEAKDPASRLAIVRNMETIRPFFQENEE
jgi:hypothetical protein